MEPEEEIYNLRKKLDKARQRNSSKQKQIVLDMEEAVKTLKNDMTVLASRLKEKDGELDRLQSIIDNQDNQQRLQLEDLDKNFKKSIEENKILQAKLTSLPTPELPDALTKRIKKLAEDWRNERDKCFKLNEKFGDGELKISEKECEIHKLEKIVTQLETLKSTFLKAEAETQFAVISVNSLEKLKEQGGSKTLAPQLLYNSVENHAGQLTLLDKQAARIKELESQVEQSKERDEENRKLRNELLNARASILSKEGELNVEKDMAIENCQKIQNLERDKFELEKQVELGEDAVRRQNEEIRKLMGEREKMMGSLQKIRELSEFPVSEIPIENQLEELEVHVQKRLDVLKHLHNLLNKGEAIIKQSPAVSTSSNANPILPSPPPPLIPPETSVPPPKCSANQPPKACASTPTILLHVPKKSSSRIRNAPENVAPLYKLSKAIGKNREGHGENIGKWLRGYDKERGKYYCYCGLICKTKSLLEQHLTQISQQKMFQCIECSKRFLRFVEWGRHMRERHRQSESRNRFVCGCQSCGELYETREMLREHNCAKRNATQPIKNEDVEGAMETESRIPGQITNKNVEVAMDTATLPEPAPTKITPVSEDENEDVDVEFD